MDMMLSGPDIFYTVLGVVRDANLAALRNTTGGAPARVGLVPGAIAWDDCDTCGLLALALARTYLSNEFPLESAEVLSVSSTQGAYLCADMVVQIIRCAPQPSDNGLSPSVDALDASARVVGADAYAVVCSTLDALNTLARADSILDFMIRPQHIMGPEGACVGSELAFTVAVMR